MAICRRTPNTTPRASARASSRAASPSSRTRSPAPRSSTSPSCRARSIKFGATVTLADEETDEEQTYQIVGEDEADIKQRPALGHLAAGARADRQGKGDSVEVVDPARLQILRDRHRRLRLSAGAHCWSMIRSRSAHPLGAPAQAGDASRRRIYCVRRRAISDLAMSLNTFCRLPGVAASKKPPFEVVAQFCSCGVAAAPSVPSPIV